MRRSQRSCVALDPAVADVDVVHHFTSNPDAGEALLAPRLDRPFGDAVAVGESGLRAVAPLRRLVHAGGDSLHDLVYERGRKFEAERVRHGPNMETPASDQTYASGPRPISAGTRSPVFGGSAATESTTGLE